MRREEGGRGREGERERERRIEGEGDLSSKISSSDVHSGERSWLSENLKNLMNE